MLPPPGRGGTVGSADPARLAPARRSQKGQVAMAPVEVDADASEVGLDAGRLARIGAYFRPYTDDGRLAGWLVLVGRAGKIAYLESYGRRNESGAPVELDTLFRIYSMTKPVTALAAMICYEEGLFDLKDPVGKFVPSFADSQILTGGSPEAPETVSSCEPMRIWHLLTHTAGLIYGFTGQNPVLSAIFEQAQAAVPAGTDLAGWCDAWARIPLLFEPGSAWNYSVAHDVLGRVVEVAAGEPLDRFFDERIFAPLGMSDTGFRVQTVDLHRLATLYALDADAGKVSPDEETGRWGVTTPDFFSGGGGLVSSASDYLRFAEMLRRRGEYGGRRVIGTRTVEYMTRNHLPGNADLAGFGVPLFADAPPERGYGYGLGVGVTIDPVARKVLCGAGTYGWAGAANTYFFVDPAEELTVLFLTQLVPFSVHPIEPRLSQLVYQAIVD
jgi:CubicO group peptidase (beta-lactamase class C family)